MNKSTQFGWPEFILVAVAVVGFVVAGVGWPKAESWGSWGEWAGAFFAGVAACTGIGIAVWSSRRHSKTERLIGAYEIVSVAGVLRDAQGRTSGLELIAAQHSQTLADRQRQIDWLNQKIIATMEHAVEPLHRMYSDSRTRLLLEIQELRDKINEIGQLADAIRVDLDRVSHVSASGFDPVFARELVKAKSHLRLASSRAQTIVSCEGVREEAAAAELCLRAAMARQDRALIYLGEN